MPFSGPGLYIISSVADKGPLSYIPESRLLAVRGGTGAVLKISQFVQDVYIIQSEGEDRPYFAHIESSPGGTYPLIVVNGGIPFRWKIAAQSGGKDELEYAVITAEGPYAPKVWTTNTLGTPTPLVLVDDDTAVPHQRFIFTRVEH